MGYVGEHVREGEGGLGNNMRYRLALLLQAG